VVAKVTFAFSVGLLVALAASGGIAGERITLGRLGVALVANAAATFAALVAARAMMRRPQVLPVLVPQVLGAVAGVVVVHLLLRRSALDALPWLSERPAQLVNDAVAVSGLLALAWACARKLDPYLLVLAFVLVTFYRVTAPAWHLDRAPAEFHATVQQLVVGQLVAAAIALGVFRTLWDRSAADPG
jgi:glycerol uptake facilitator-like aquaporin